MTETANNEAIAGIKGEMPAGMAMPTRRPVRKADPSQSVNRRLMPLTIVSPARAPMIEAATERTAELPKQYMPHPRAGRSAAAVPHINDALVRL